MTTILPSGVDLMNLREVEAKLDKFGTYEVNWDSYGGAAISKLAVRSAKAILNAFYTYAHSSIPHTTPTADGGISLHWGDEDVYIDISADGTARVWTDGVPDEE